MLDVLARRQALALIGATFASALACAGTPALAADRPVARANVVSPAWKPELLAEPEPAESHKLILPSRVSFNSPALQPFRTASPDFVGNWRDRVDVAAPRLLELHRLAAIGRRPLLKRWRKGTSSPFDFMTAPLLSIAVLPSIHVADAERWAAVLEAIEIGDACECLAASAPGRVPNGDDLPGIPLLLSRNGAVPSNLDLSWSASCSSSAEDYAIYQGTIGVWNVHTPAVCSTASALSATLTPPAGSTYYLIVPLDPSLVEGSYGVDWTGADRPPSGSPCRPVFTPDTCP